MECRGGELCIDRWQGDALSPGNSLDLAPSLRDPFIKRKESAGKADAQIVIQPTLKRRSLRFVFVEQVDVWSTCNAANTSRLSVPAPFPMA